MKLGSSDDPRVSPSYTKATTRWRLCKLEFQQEVANGGTGLPVERRGAVSHPPEAIQTGFFHKLIALRLKMAMPKRIFGF